MFFNVKGIKLAIALLLGVALLCVLDLRCSFARDRAAQEKDESTLGGVISHVREEVAAGHREQAVQRMDQINEQLRDLRVIARRMVKAGKMRDVRKVFAAIQELEAVKARLEKRAQDDGKTHRKKSGE